MDEELKKNLKKIINQLFLNKKVGVKYTYNILKKLLNFKEFFKKKFLKIYDLYNISFEIIVIFKKLLK